MRRLTDAYVDGAITREAFDERRASLALDQRELAAADSDAGAHLVRIREHLARDLELATDAYLSYRMADPEKKRRLLLALTSNREVDRKHLAFTLGFPFSEIAKRFAIPHGDPHRDIPRTWDRLIPHLLDEVGVYLPSSQRLEEQPTIQHDTEDAIPNKRAA